MMSYQDLAHMTTSVVPRGLGEIGIAQESRLRRDAAQALTVLMSGMGLRLHLSEYYSKFTSSRGRRMSTVAIYAG